MSTIYVHVYTSGYSILADTVCVHLYTHIHSYIHMHRYVIYYIYSHVYSYILADTASGNSQNVGLLLDVLFELLIALTFENFWQLHVDS